MKMYVGNLSFETTVEELKEVFSPFGEVTDIHMPADRESGRPRGFGFVTMATKEAMEEAIKTIDGTELAGRVLKVNAARPKEDRSRSSRGRY